MTIFFANRGLGSAVIGGLSLLLASCGEGRQTAAFPQPERAPAELSAKVDKAVVNPGDIITFTLTADYWADVSLELPEIADKFWEFRIAGSGVSQPLQKGDRLVAERWYKLQADISGSYVIEPIEITYDLPDGGKEAAKTPKIFLEVESLLAKDGEAKDIRDIKPPMSVSPSYRVFFMISAILAGVITLLLFGRKLIERLKSKMEAEKFTPRPAHEEALEALQKLLKKRLIEKGHAREFCFEISEIFRRYMQARFDIPAIDLTTDEILPRVEDDGIIAEDIKPMVREFLTSTDLVKFAKYQPLRDEMEKILENARTFIDTTAMTAVTGAATASGGEIR